MISAVHTQRTSTEHSVVGREGEEEEKMCLVLVCGCGCTLSFFIINLCEGGH